MRHTKFEPVSHGTITKNRTYQTEKAQKKKNHVTSSFTKPKNVSHEKFQTLNAKSNRSNRYQTYQIRKSQKEGKRKKKEAKNIFQSIPK